MYQNDLSYSCLFDWLKSKHNGVCEFQVYQSDNNYLPDRCTVAFYQNVDHEL